MPQSSEIVEAMKRPETYDSEVRDIRIKQTHISWVFLTGKFAYKVKKPVDFGFLDFTTLDNRLKFCRKELEINRMLSPDIYLGVLPINKSGQGIKLNGPGETVEYAIKMKELPQENLMTKMLERGLVDTKTMERVVETLMEFYSNTHTYRDPNSTGSLETVKFNWRENFRQAKPFIGRTLDRKTFDTIKERTERFMASQKKLFDRRLREGRVKWCHGDLHSGNIFVIHDRIVIFDAIEFNERFACSDVAGDIAFLSMDLDFRHRKYLSGYFVKKYVEKSGDSRLMELLDFYKCYRAYVRGKVTGFRMDDPGVSKDDKKKAKDEAGDYFRLALDYSGRF